MSPLENQIFLRDADKTSSLVSADPGEGEGERESGTISKANKQYMFSMQPLTLWKMSYAAQLHDIVCELATMTNT
jgi:hypothetical protein